MIPFPQFLLDSLGYTRSVRTRIFYTHTPRTTRVSRYHKGKTNLDFTEARDSEWQWHQLGHITSLHLARNRQPCQHPTTQFFQAGCPSCRPTNSVKTLKAKVKVGLSKTTMKISLLCKKQSTVLDEPRFLHWTEAVLV